MRDEHQIIPDTLRAGNRVYAKRQNKGYYPAEIISRADEKINVKYDSGDTEWTTIDVVQIKDEKIQITGEHEISGKNIIVEYINIDQKYAMAVLNLCQAIHDAYKEKFGLEEISAVKGEKIRVRLEINPALKHNLWTNPASPKFSQICWNIPSENLLRPPGKGGPHIIYGFCHEFGHIVIGWKDCLHAWAHYTGSVIVEEIQKKLGDKAWPEPYDYQAMEGLSRLKGEIESAQPELGTANGVAKIFYLVGEKYGTDIFGKALDKVKQSTDYEAFHSVKLYYLKDLKKALIELTDDEKYIEGLFK